MKRMGFKYHILICFVGLIFISAKGGCNKEEQNKADVLIGKWDWVKTFCCGRGNSVWTNPESCACTQTLLLNSDGTYQKTKDNKIIKEGNYILRKGLNDYQFSAGDTNNVIVFDEDYAAYLRIDNDTLMITRGYMDLESDYYVKVAEQTK